MNITRKVGTDLHFLCPASIYTHSVAWPRAWTITDLTEQFGAIGLILRSVRGTGCQSTSSDLSGIATESPWCKYEQISGQQTLVMNYFQHPISGKIVSPFEEKEKKKKLFSLSLWTPPQNNMGERRGRANIQQEIFLHPSWRKTSPHKSKQDGALEPHLPTWGNQEKKGKMPGPMPSIQHCACSAVMWHLKLWGTWSKRYKCNKNSHENEPLNSMLSWSAMASGNPPG